MLFANSPVELQSYKQEQGAFIYTTGEGACDRDTELEWGGRLREGVSVRKRRLDSRDREKECENKDGDTLTEIRMNKRGLVS